MLILSPVHRWRLPAAAAFAILLLLVACKKNETPPAPNPTTVVTSLSSQNLHAGDTLFLRGKSFGSSASVVHIQLDTFTLTIDRCQGHRYRRDPAFGCPAALLWKPHTATERRDQYKHRL
ncbi:hypothetical protein ACQ86N_19855 [Puia sp. P3]|uniref:hypothetical protein n=1 Tax=Puia sp. P3 TaxID=3423952 RepID=UPI003D66C62B